MGRYALFALLAATALAGCGDDEGAGTNPDGDATADGGHVDSSRVEGGAAQDASRDATADATLDGGSDAQHDGAAQADGATRDAAADGAVDAGLDAAPVVAAFGLDTRPTNPTCVARPRPAQQPDAVVARVFPNVPLGAAIALQQPPGDPTRWWVADLNGQLQSFAASESATSLDMVLDLHTVPGSVAVVGEGGLLGFAFHPQFAINRYVYVSYTAPSDTAPSGIKSVVARFKSNDGGVSLDASTATVLLAFDQPFVNHNGGNILFGPDGYLYVGFGDGGGVGDLFGNGQATHVLFGKILRIDVDGASPYGIPPDNPFANGVAGAKEIFALGFRNPWRFGFDRALGTLWVGDVGQDAYEEIDRVERGGNYGWNCREGLHPFSTAPPCTTLNDFVDPIFEYSHGGLFKSVTGGYVYRGAAIPSLFGKYVFGDFETGEIWKIDPQPGASAVQINPSGPTFYVVSFAEGADGELYVADYAGKVFKIVPSAPPVVDPFPLLLSQTGCVDPNDATRPAPGLVPYDVNAPLWSDGARAERYVALPDNTTIHVGADGDWELPKGSVVVQTFTRGGARIETRLLMRHDDGAWAGYSYQWNDSGTDAALLPSNDLKNAGGGGWYFPSRPECARCHTAAAGVTLGLETPQLDRDFVYTATNRIANQVATLAQIGMLDATPPPGTALPSPTGSAAVDARARAHLHANCSMCHRPGGTSPSLLDLRFTTPFADVNACNVAPQSGDLGVSGAQLLVPGDPSHSLISLRTHTLGPKRMPPLASLAIDVAGTQTLDDWIASQTSCP